MGFFSLITVLVSTVYPVVASYKAFEDYSRAANEMASSQFKVAGITVPIGLLIKQNGTGNVSADTERAVQVHLITIQKWFVYWIVLASTQLAESVLFLKYVVPFYSVFKFAYRVWLVWPMIMPPKSTDPTKTFDTTEDWINFTSNGAGVVFFLVIRPWIEGVHVDPQALLQKFKPDEKEQLSQTFGKLLDSSYVMVSNIAGAAAGTASSGVAGLSTTTAKSATGVNTAAADPPIAAPEEDFDLINKEGLTQRRKGWLW